MLRDTGLSGIRLPWVELACPPPRITSTYRPPHITLHISPSTYHPPHITLHISPSTYHPPRINSTYHLHSYAKNLPSPQDLDLWKVCIPTENKQLQDFNPDDDRMLYPTKMLQSTKVWLNLVRDMRRELEQRWSPKEKRRLLRIQWALYMHWDYLSNYGRSTTCLVTPISG